MKNVLAIALFCLFSLSIAADQAASKTSTVEDQIKGHEQNWAQATVKEGAAANMKPMTSSIPTPAAALPTRPKTRRL